MSDFGFHAPKNRLLETLWAGANYFVDVHKEKNVITACNKYVSILHANVFHIQKLIRYCRNNGVGSLSLRAITIGGSKVTHGLTQKIKEHLTKNLIVRYASNETGPITYIAQPNVFSQPDCVGKPLSKIKINILNEHNRLSPAGQPGLIAIQSPGNFDGYVNDESTKSNYLTAYGFDLGDLGRIDEEGSLYHLGRADQMMIFNGMNIYPAEIENVLLKHPKVDDAISFPLSHPVYQDIPVAAISVKTAERVLEGELLHYCKTSLRSHAPQRVFILNKLPRNERGKINISALKS